MLNQNVDRITFDSSGLLLLTLNFKYLITELE
jgi:hypothetical protein